METRTGYKQTEIGEIPEEWEVVNLQDVVSVNPESLDPTTKWPNKEFEYVDIEAVKEGRITTVKRIIGKDAPSRARRIIREKDVIMSTVRPYLKAFTPISKKYDGSICSTGFAVLRPTENVNHIYLFYAILSERTIKQCNAMMRGGQYPALNQSQVQQLTIPLPKLPEQQKIAEILSTVDDAIQKSDEIIQKTQLLKNGLLHHLLTRGIGHNKFKQTEIGEIPEEWEYGIIENFANTIGDSVQTGPFGAQLHASDYVKDGVPLILIKNVFDGKIVDEDMPRISHKKAEELSRYRLKIGDIVFSRVGSVGRAAVVREREEGWLISGQMLRVRLDNPRIENVFLGHVINTKWFKKALESKTVGATRKSINTNILRSLPLIVPPLPEQQKIAEILSTVDKKIELEMKRKGQFEQIKQGLMNDLLTGKKRLN